MKKSDVTEGLRCTALDLPMGLWRRVRDAAAARHITFRDFMMRAAERELARKEK